MGRLGLSRFDALWGVDVSVVMMMRYRDVEDSPWNEKTWRWDTVNRLDMIGRVMTALD